MFRRFQLRLIAALAVASILSLGAEAAKAGDCHAGQSFQQLAPVQQFQSAAPLCVDQAQQTLQVQAVPVQQYQFRAVQSQAYYGFAPVQQLRVAAPVYQNQTVIRQTVIQAPPVIQQNVIRQNVVRQNVIQAPNQFQGNRRFAGNGGQSVEIRPTGLARLFGVGGPDISIRGGGGGGVSVQPTGLARLFGTGGQRVNVR
jgi:hypothetical protein